jgi:hypothetical protein
MVVARVVGTLFVLLSLYYLRFFALRQEATTLVQIAALLGAAGILFLHGRRPAAPGAAWRTWLTALAVLPAMASVFLMADRDSHSVSDTLQRIVPTFSLLTAFVIKR